MDPALLLKFVHILAVVVFLGNLATQAYWKVGVDRARNVQAVSVVMDRLHKSGKITGGAALVVFATGYPIIRTLGHFGGSIGGAPFALWGLILMFLALAVWYFAMRPLEVRMANLADDALEKGFNLGKDYARASGVWLSLLLVVVGLLVFVAYLMVMKPWG